MARPIQSSFSSGELSPALHSRVDYERYYTGLALARNYYVLKEGGIQTRAGFEYTVQCVAGNAVTRLIEFEFSAEQTYILMFSDSKIRFVRNGGALLNSSKVISSVSGAFPATIGVVGHGYSDDDIVFITNTGAPGLDNQYFKISGVTANTFDVTGDSTGGGSGNSASVYEIASPYSEADIFRLKYTQSADVMTITHPSYPVHDLSRLAEDNWDISEKNLGSSAVPPASITVVRVGDPSGADNKEYRYVVTTVDENGDESIASPIGSDGGGFNSLSITYGNKITWAAVPGAEFYRVYKENFLNSGIFGLLGEANDLEFQDYNFLGQLDIAPPNQNIIFDSADNYPSCTEYHDQRLMFGRTNNEVQNVWGSKTGNFENFDFSRPAQDDDSLEFTLAAKKVNEIRHLISLENLLVFTSGSIWKVSGPFNGILTPTSIDARRQGTRGCSELDPIVVGDTVLFVQEKGARVRDLNYVFDSDSYTGNDLSVFSEHLLKGYSIVDWCFSEEPYSVLWLVRSDGALLSLSYLREQQVYGWCRHDTQGEFESVASISEGDEDAVYAVIKRNVGGEDVRYVERLHERGFDDIKDAFCVDGGVTYSGASTDTIYGLGHLEGESVVALGDGNVYTDLLVSGGRVVLPEPVEIAHVGLSFVADAQTLPLNFSQSQIQSKKKTINRVVLRVLNTRGLKVGSRPDKLYETKERDVTMGYSNIPTLTGQQFIQVNPDWSDYGDVFIRQDKPLPATILASIPEVQT